MSTFLALILIVPPFPLFAQFPFENPTVLNTENGLPTDRVRSLAEDENGVMWMATDNGLARYDGLTMETFQEDADDSTSLVSHNIHFILPDIKNGIVWLATDRGLSILNLKTKKFKNYIHDPADPNSIPDFALRSIFKDKDEQIWIGTLDKGIVKFRPETDDFEYFICEAGKEKCGISARYIQADLENDSILWLAGRGITRFNRMDGSFQNFKYQSNDEKELRYVNSPTDLLVHPNGKIYFGTWYVGVYVFDLKSRAISRFEPCYKNGTFHYESTVVLSFLPLNEHEFWINSRSGAQLFDTRTGCITKAYQSDPVNKVWYSLDHMDRKGRIWNTFRANGLRIFNPLMQQYEYLYYDEEDSPFVSHTRGAVEDTVRHRIYVSPSGTSEGLSFYDLKAKTWTVVLPPDDYKENDLKGINIVAIGLLHNGEVIVLSPNKIFWYRPGWPKLRPYPVQPSEKVVRFRGCMVDSEGNAWLGAWTGGFYRLNPRTKELHSFQAEFQAQYGRPLTGDFSVVDIRGNVWMRASGALLIWEKATEKLIYHPYDPSDIKAFRGMGRMAADIDGRVWVATHREFLGYGHADSLGRGIIRFLGKKEGLIGTKVRLVKIHGDHLLVFTNRGMQLFDPATMRFGKLFDAGYGLGSSVYSGTWLSDGRLATCHQKAIALFHPDSLKTNAELPVPYVTSFRVFDEKYDLESGPGQTDSIYLSYAQNFFSFEFSAVGYNLPEKTTFQYMLEGFDEKWQDGTERKFAAYTNVPGGDYTFKIKATNNEGLSLGEPHKLFLHVSTVWYKTVWFWCLAFILFAVISYLIYKWRIAQVRKEERLRSEYERQLANVEMSALRAQMNPHFIFNCLNSIEYYIITNEPEKAVDYLGRFSKLIRLILQNSKNSIVPLKDDLEALKLYIEMESLRFDNLFDYEVKMEKDIDAEKTVVPPMLMQPYVENAIWHGLMQKKGEKGKIDLTLRKSNGHLVCLIEDNGIGREAAKKLKSKSATKRKSYGMKITSDRLAALNQLAGADGSVDIYDLKKEDGTAAGTRVELVIPL